MRDVSELAPPWVGIRAESVLLAPTSLGGTAVAFESGKGMWTAATIDPYAVGGRAASTLPPPTIDLDKPVAGVRSARFEVRHDSEVVAVLDQLGPAPSASS
jgi:hypothetical protein